MILVIDCFKLVKGVGKSIGIYNLTLNLVRSLVEEQKYTSNKKIKNCDIVVLGNMFNKSDFDIEGIKFISMKYNPLNTITCVLWELILVTGICKKLKADRVLFPRGFCALTHPIKDTVIIHDLIPFYYDKYYKGFFNKLTNAYIMWRLKASIKTCNQVITISETSKKDISDIVKINEKKIIKINNGCNRLVYTDKKQSTEQYIVAITSDLPHKNAKGIIRSYAEYCKISEKPLNMIVIGLEDIQKYELPNEVKSKIKCYKFIKKDYDMHRMIGNGVVFLFLSLIEGFGFPPIEAMQLGVPVICSNISSLPEVVGDAAMLVDPNDYTAVGKTIDRLVKDENLRGELVQKGHKNVQRFFWDSRSKLYWDALIK